MIILNGDYPIDESKNMVRYISFTKFVDLILSEEIYFANAKMLSDQYEFNLTDNHKKEVFTEYLKFYDQKKAEEIVEIFEKTVEIHKNQIYINSWSEESDESYAMWKIYLGGQDGVSIKTDFNCMKKAFEESKAFIQIGKILYSNQLGEHSGDPKMVFRKMKFYEFENEVRLYYYSSINNIKVVDDQTFKIYSLPEQESKNLNVNGFKVKVDLDSLIKEIRISPFSNKSFEQLVVDFLSKVRPSLKNKIKKSLIMDK